MPVISAVFSGPDGGRTVIVEPLRMDKSLNLLFHRHATILDSPVQPIFIIFLIQMLQVLVVLNFV